MSHSSVESSLLIDIREPFLETQQPQHLMPPAVAQLPENERMGQPAILPPSVTSASNMSASNVLAANISPHAYNNACNKAAVGATVGISSNPLYAQADIASAVIQEPITTVIPTTVAQVDLQAVSFCSV